jgi:DNA primase
MPLYPQAFVDEVRFQADIVQVVQETVPLRKVGATYKGLCPFHAEKTPSFQVNREKGFFHCFGCGVGGDVFKFVELRDRIGFGEAIRHLAERFGIPVPKALPSGDPAADSERETLLRIHEVAAAFFRAQLAGAGGRGAREMLAGRGVTDETVARLGLGLAPSGWRGLKDHLAREGFSVQAAVRSGMLTQREDGETYDRFRNRLMIPICRESGSPIAFGGRAMLPDQVPKYLNSPETPIYSKSRTLYGLHLSKGAIREEGQAVIVEGYFDFAQAWQAGVTHVVATCGTAMTPTQAQLLRRFANRVVLSYDGDAAGQGASERSCELLVSEGFQVRVAVLPAGEDPDTFARRKGAAAYRETVAGAEPYLEYLLDRTAKGHNLTDPDSRRDFIQAMLAVAARIPDAPARDQFADRIAHQAQVNEDVVRAEIRKAAVARRTSLPAPAATDADRLKPAERHLLAALLHDPARAMDALASLDEADFEGLGAAGILRTALGLRPEAPDAVPGLLIARLSEGEAGLLTALAAGGSPADPVECARALRLMRYERERGALQREIDRLQSLGAAADPAAIDDVLTRKTELLTRLEVLKT